MPEEPPSGLPPLDAYRNWKPEAQAKAIELLREREQSHWRPFYCPNAACNGHPHCTPAENRDCTYPTGHPWTTEEDKWGLPGVWHCSECGVGGAPVDDWLWEHARADQRPPNWRDDWLSLLFSGGRGSGKTRSGSEITHRVTEIFPRVILIAPTGPDLRATMVEGQFSGILATSPPGKKPEWEPSKKQLTWPNGCIGLGFSAEEPDRLRGPESGFIWADEPAHYPDSEEVLDNAMFGLRLKGKRGLQPKVVLTTTPKPTKWMKATVKSPDTITRRVSSYVNLVNLADAFRKTVLAKHEGTRKGRQELYGELLEDVEGSLWNWDMIRHKAEHPHLVRVIVAVDPAGSTNKRSDITGIIVVGIDEDKTIWVLADESGKYTPSQWADKAVAAYEFFSADAIVAEKNYGGDMVRNTLENSRHIRDLGPRILLVNSRRGKAVRAEPIVALYEKKRVWHVGERGDLQDLEDEQTEWVPGVGDSPNRVDALVHGITELAKHIMPAEFADPNKVIRGNFGGRWSA